MHLLFEKAIYNNRWLWFHILAGGILAKVFHYFFDAQKSIVIVLILAIIYEIYQWISGEHRNFLDAIGDVFGAFFMAVIVCI